MNRDPTFFRADALSAGEAIELPAPPLGCPASQGELAPSIAAEVAVLVGFVDGGAVPLVLRAGEVVAQRAESLLDLRGEHLGRRLALMPLKGEESRWLVIGLLAGQSGWPGRLAAPASSVEVQADGRRMTILASDELTLRCGKSLVKLRADGRIEIRGETIVSESVRANRVRGGSVELN